MPGYNYAGSKQGQASARGGSPVLFLLTFKRKALDAFDRAVVNARKSGADLGEVEAFVCLPFEQCNEVRQVMKRCSGRDKDGNPLMLFLERFHVGGQLAERRAEEAEG